MKKKSTLELYNELFKKPYDFNDMFFMKHQKEFHEKYPDCPNPGTIDCLNILIDEWETWDDEYEPDYYYFDLTEKLGEILLDRDVLEYLDKNVKEPELRDNLCFIINPLKNVHTIKLSAQDGEWYFKVRVKEMDTSEVHKGDFYPDDELPCEDDWDEFYFNWNNVLARSYGENKIEDKDAGKDGDPMWVYQAYEEPNVVLMRWNPAISNFKKEEWMKLLKEHREGACMSLSWSVWDHDKVKVGDTVYMLMVGEGRTGVVATGVIDGEPYKDEDWSGKGRETYYVDIVLTEVFNPDGYILPLEVLQMKYGEIDWNHGHSGIVIERNDLKDSINEDYKDFYENMYLHRPEKFRDRP